jgi:hypothetical protein
MSVMLELETVHERRRPLFRTQLKNRQTRGVDLSAIFSQIVGFGHSRRWRQ